MSKRTIVLIVGLVMIAVFVLLNALVFTVRNVQVEYDAESNVTIEEGLTEKIINASGIKTGKNIFSVSESKIVANIQAGVPNVRVINIERRFPNKVVIHVSQRVPVFVISYKQSQMSSSNFVLVDSDMVVLELTDDATGRYTRVEGFSLMGRLSITIGKTLSVGFGNEIYYLQNIAAGFYNIGLTPDSFVEFVNAIRFDDDIIDIVTNSGVIIRLGSGLTTEDIAERVPKAYRWYEKELQKGDDNPALKDGIVLYNNGKFIHNDYE